MSSLNNPQYGADPNAPRKQPIGIAVQGYGQPQVS